MANFDSSNGNPQFRRERLQNISGRPSYLLHFDHERRYILRFESIHPNRFLRQNILANVDYVLFVQTAI